MRIKKTVAALAIVAAATTLSACSGSSDSSAPSGGNAMTATQTAPTSDTSAPSSDAAAPGAKFGSACSAVPTSGPGSFTGMAADPVATAASNNPVLSTLVTAVKKAGLVDTLNSAQNITVFAPYNGAFEKIPAATLNKVLADKAGLTKLLEHHVIGQKLAPSDLNSGSFKSLAGDMVTTTGSGQDFTVDGIAKVICGNVQTANATVYIIDTVLTK